MISAESFIKAAGKHGFSLYSGVPCSYLKPFINYVIDDPELTYIGAANEGDAVAIASGAHLGGKRSVVMFQNSGFGNAVSPISSLNMIFNIPVLIITTHRGEPGGPQDEPQHDLMGHMTDSLFDIMKVPHEIFPREEHEIEGGLNRAVTHMDKTGTPYGFIMKKDTVASHTLQSKPVVKPISAQLSAPERFSTSLPTRREVLTQIVESTTEKDILFATTGFSGRSLYAVKDRPNHLYMVGSMGCIPVLGLGFALARPDLKTIVIDGDGAALMRLGAYATVGYERPANLLHILIDNEVHDSTGGQSTVSHSVDLAAVAAACGYPKVIRAKSVTEIFELCKNPISECTFVHIKTAPGEPKDLPRPKVTPIQVTERLMSLVQSL